MLADGVGGSGERATDDDVTAHIGAPWRRSFPAMTFLIGNEA
jgi:hypothetical protein